MPKQKPSPPPVLPQNTDADSHGVTPVTLVTYRMFIILVTLIALALAGLYYLASFPPYVRQVLYILSYVDALILLFDFLMRFAQAPHKMRYLLPWGLLDLAGSLPGRPFLRLLRVPSLVIDWRELRQGTTRDLRATVRNRLAESTLLSGLIVVFLVMAAGGMAMVWVEAPVEGSNIKTGADALWYAIVTIATVGYGDRYPITTAGRIIGAVMIVVGVGIFSVLTGFISTQFLARGKHAGQHENNALQQEMTKLLEEQRMAAAAEHANLEQEIANLRDELAKRA